MQPGRRAFLALLMGAGSLVGMPGCLRTQEDLVTAPGFIPLGGAPETPGSLPIQEILKNEAPIKFNATWALHAFARYAIHARIMSVKRYWFDALSDIAPLDLALAWGAADQDVIQDTLKISQWNRWYRWRANTLLLPASTLNASMANVHIIPATEDVRRALLALDKDDRASLQGRLVDLHHADGRIVKSSRSRNDFGAGACEILYVERLVRHRSA